jgi:hypothetical protein
MTDLGFTGLPYTWDNRQHGGRNIKVRLDRGLGDDRFKEKFDNTIVTHVQTTESDHCALLISLGRSDWLGGGNTGRPFRYENMWARHDGYSAVIQNSWATGNRNLTDVQMALSQLRQNLTHWSINEFGSVNKQLRTMRKKLEMIRANSLGCGPSREEKNLMYKISELLSREETMMKQRSRVQWLAEGDQNTAYFHTKARDRARTNNICIFSS